MSAMAILDLWKTQERLRSSSSNFDKPDCIKAKFFLPKSRSENVNPISVDNLFAHVCIQFVSCCVLWKFVYTQIASHNLLRKTPLLRKSKTRNIDVISLTAQKEKVDIHSNPTLIRSKNRKCLHFLIEVLFKCESGSKCVHKKADRVGPSDARKKGWMGANGGDQSSLAICQDF